MADNFSVRGEVTIEATAALANIEALSSALGGLNNSFKKSTSESKSTSKGLDDAGTASEKASKKVKNFGDSVSGVAWVTTTVYLQMMARELLKVASAALEMSIEFEASMDKAQAALAADVPAENLTKVMEYMREVAIQVGKDTVFSTKEAADGVTELAKAGMDAATIYGGGLKAAMDLAAVGNLGVARSAELLASTMNQFSTQGVTASQVANVLAAAANSAQGDVSDLELALAQVGPTAARMNFSLEETAGGIKVLSELGVTGRKAGTSLKAMFAQISAPTDKAKKLMDELGISFYNADGKMKSLAEIAGVLQDTFREGSPVIAAYAAKNGLVADEASNAAVQTLFLSDGANAAAAMIKAGAAGIEYATESLENMATAAEMAAMQQDNLAGDIEKFWSEIEGAITSTGISDAFRGLIQGVTELIETHPYLVQFAAGFTAVGGAAALSIGSLMQFMTMAGGIKKLLMTLSQTEVGGQVIKMFASLGAGVRTTVTEMQAMATEGMPALTVASTGLKAGLSGLKVAVTGVANALMTIITNPIVLGLAAVTAAVTVGWKMWDAYKQRQQEVNVSIQDLVGTLDEATGALTENSNAVIKNMLQAENGGWSETYEAVHLLTSEYIKATGVLDEYRNVFGGLSGEADAMYTKAWDVSDAIENISRVTGESSISFTVLTAAVNRGREGIDRLVDAWVAEAKQSSMSESQIISVVENYELLRQMMYQVSGYVDESSAEFKKLQSDLAILEETTGGSTDALMDFITTTLYAVDAEGQFGDAVADTVDELFASTSALRDTQGSIDNYYNTLIKAFDAEKLMADGLDGNTQSARDNRAAFDEVIDAAEKMVLGMASSTMSVDEQKAAMAEAEAAFMSAAHVIGIDSVRAQEEWDTNIKANTVSMYDNMAVIREQQSELGDYNAAAMAVGGTLKTLEGATFKQTAAQYVLSGATEGSTEDLYKLGERAGLTKAQVDSYVAALKKAPPEVITQVRAEGVKATQDAINNIRGKTVSVYVDYREASVVPGGLAISANAAGGYIRGPGTGVSDSILSWLSNGEYVVRAAAVDKYGKDMLDRINTMRFAAGGFAEQYATGGPVVNTQPRYTNNAGPTINDVSATMQMQQMAGVYDAKLDSITAAITDLRNRPIEVTAQAQAEFNTAQVIRKFSQAIAPSMQEVFADLEVTTRNRGAI